MQFLTCDDVPIHSLADAAMSVLNTVHKQKVEEVSQRWKMASPKVVAVVEQYKHDCPELTGRQIRIKLVEGRVCSEGKLPSLSAIYDILRRLLAKGTIADFCFGELIGECVEVSVVNLFVFYIFVVR